MDTRPIDADNHYYESLDAFTRHLDKKFRDRGVKPVQSGKHYELLMGGTVNRFIPNPTFDPDHRAGLHGPALPRADPRGRGPAQPHAGRAAARRVPGPRQAGRGDGRARSRRRAALPDLGLRRRRGPAQRHRGHHGVDVRLQPLAGGGLGLRLRAPDHRRAHALSGRSGGGRGRGRVADRAGRAHRARPAGSGTGSQRDGPLARRQVARSGLGPAGRGVGSGGLPPRRQRLQPFPGGRVGRQLRASRDSATRTSSAGSWCRTGPSTTPSPRSSSTRCSSATPRCGSPASRTGRTGWPCW